MAKKQFPGPLATAQRSRYAFERAPQVQHLAQLIANALDYNEVGKYAGCYFYGPSAEAEHDAVLLHETQRAVRGMLPVLEHSGTMMTIVSVSLPPQQVLQTLQLAALYMDKGTPSSFALAAAFATMLDGMDEPKEAIDETPSDPDPQAA